MNETTKKASRVPDMLRRALGSLPAVILGALLGIAFFGLVCWGSLEPAAHAWNSNEFEGEGALRIPSWPARFVVVAGTALATIQYLISAWQHLQAARAGTYAPVGPTRAH